MATSHASVADFSHNGKMATRLSIGGQNSAGAGIHDLTFHDLRHSAASWLLEAGVDFVVIEKLLGHRLHGMGEGYIHNWEARLCDAVTRLEAFLLEKFRQVETPESDGVGS